MMQTTRMGAERLLLATLRRPLDRGKCPVTKCKKSTMAATATHGSEGDTDLIKPRPFEEIPGPRFLPFLGTLLDYSPLGPYQVERIIEASLDRYRKYGKIWMESIGVRPTVNVVDPHDVETIFKHDGKTPIRMDIDPMIMAREKYKRSIGVGNMQGKEWRRVRRSVQPFVMRPKSLATCVPVLDEICNDFVSIIKRRRLEDGEVPDFQNEIYKWSLESVCSVVMDTRLGCLEKNLDSNSEAQLMIDATGDFFTYLNKLVFGFPLYKFISTPSWRKFLKSQDIMFRTAQKYVDETIARVKALEEKGELGNEASLLVSLLAREELTYKEMIVMPVELIGGGIDTTSNSLVFNLYNLATNPDKQEKLYEEIMSVVPSSGEITAEALNKMTFLKGCIKETFRIFPGGLGVNRITSKDMVLGGYHIPAGTMVMSNNIAGLLEEYFPEPEKFIPERWIRGHDMQTDVNPFILLPFGHGARMCLGRRVAEEELKTVMAKLVQHFRLEWKHGPMGMVFRILHAPDKPARFNFIDRK
ncbi:probable cytochrome P450 CYP44 [Ptychodera flava]|uniref:probable cytochrome P450 CYP44 n=1 Tax=Ptychodera flava TaxID=63121 RepID=UPI003969EDC9